MKEISLNIESAALIEMEGSPSNRLFKHLDVHCILLTKALLGKEGASLLFFHHKQHFQSLSRPRGREEGWERGGGEQRQVPEGVGVGETYAAPGAVTHR